jgi:hypothetical protein
MNSIAARTAALLLTAVLFLTPWCAVAQEYLGPPDVSVSDLGSTIDKVTIEAYGVLKPNTARRYLKLRHGSVLTQEALDHDFTDLQRVGSFRTRVQIFAGSAPHTVDLHWIVMSRWLKPTSHPYYGDAPLSAPIQGVGFIVTSPQVDQRGTNFSAYTQLSKRANLARMLFTEPLTVNPVTGRENSFIADISGGRGVYRASQPLAINVYSWTTGAEALFLSQGVNGTQFESGVRLSRSTDEANSAIEAPSLYNTFLHPARMTQLVAGVSHACISGPYRWYPPYCNMQYRVQATDAVGGFGATQLYRVISADIARYWAVGESTAVLHASAVRSGGVLPDSFLVCAQDRGYPKPFCGTDAEGATFEYRIDDAKARPLEVVLFTEDSASRVRAGDQAYALPYFTWHPDTGIGLEYHLVRFDLAYGKGGGRLTFELKGQLY